MALSADAGQNKVIVRQQGGRVRHVRSTLLISGIAELRARGLLDTYVKWLPREAADVLFPGVAATWLPVEIGEAHYGACDRLGLNPEECFAIGGSSGTRLQQSLLQTFVRLAQGAGVSPLSLFPAYPRIWGRHFDGGNLVIDRVGPKDVTMEIRDFPYATHPYFRHGFRGMNTEGLKLFARTVYVRETFCGPTALTLRISWV